ncbi:polymorphic toxin type 50 domain-containing protein [Caldibacillus lycopersici]|uniref:Polymorphic toxin type 50 domain-containing protein n=1 Tax=Perspicuibacillus lycopersici TaxID=1325689 RepID=A0AAE3ITH2_9BACI|nr:phage minor capsid protein [Perspicuibacillus lycopersici]MCU9614092.1 polymorphic toxin type 50 domain-containing protein [Perspicuibacillus lycopersici]
MMELIKKFLALFSKASNNIINRIRNMTNPNEENEILQQVVEILNKLVEKSSKLLPSIIKKSYKNGSEEAIKSLLNQGFSDGEIIKPIKSIVHQDAIQAIINEAFYSILEATDNMSEDVKGRIREVVKTANENVLQGISRKRAVQDAAKLLTEKDITGIVDAAGRRWPIDKYMANVIQYHQRKAHVEGSINRMIENDLDLVYVNFVGVTCERCAQYQGRVYSLSGKDKRFPKLDVRPPYHSHCVHSVSAWVEDYMDEEEIQQAIKESNRPFTDNRTEENIREYERIQREKSKQNETRKQWIRYKQRLPNDTPDLKIFASLKARNTKSFQDLQNDYRKVGMYIKAKEDILGGKYPLRVNPNKQKRHIEGTSEYQDYVKKLEKRQLKPSILKVDANQLVKQYHGTGRIIVTSSNQPPKEAIKADYVVGIYFDSTIQQYIPTKSAMIVYSRTGIHVYPKEDDLY